MPPRRQTIIPSISRAAASDEGSLGERLARMELRLKELQTALDLQSKRTISLQAQLDHLVARSTHR